MSSPIAMQTISYQNSQNPPSERAEREFRARERCSKIYRVVGGVFVGIGVAGMTIVPAVAKSVSDDGLVMIGVPSMVIGLITAMFGGWLAISECECSQSSERDMFVV